MTLEKKLRYTVYGTSLLTVTLSLYGAVVYSPAYLLYCVIPVFGSLYVRNTVRKRGYK